jgi:hypothetical protein
MQCECDNTYCGTCLGTGGRCRECLQFLCESCFGDGNEDVCESCYTAEKEATRG